MATPYITIGCPTTGGGQVMSGNSIFLIEGIAIACVGDKATCPKHKTVATIISGDPHMQVMGKAAARVNDSLSCGCKLLPKQCLVVQENGGGIKQASQINDSNTILSSQNNFISDTTKEIYKIQFKFIDEDTGHVLRSMPYEIYSKNSGELLIKGYTDNSGRTALYESESSPESIELITVDLSKILDPL
ncbi:PAAR domain-containing protein [Acinetobacter guerrae]|uniref:PAAR domain-containing protein n=1 Tax=Acinetobacter guerrae TaxID=1843371 RepID=UPI00125FD839|nr:PAAR domain-containing protein [Acinetobacter guerrae]